MAHKTLDYGATTLLQLKRQSKRVYPSSLDDVEANLYKHPSSTDYLLLDDLNKDGTLPILFYRGKWRQENVEMLQETKVMKISEYELVSIGGNVGSPDNNILTLEQLKNLTLTIIKDNEFELVQTENWVKYFNHKKPTQSGYTFNGYKDDLNDDACFVLSSEILAVLEIYVFKLHNGFKTKHFFTAVIPDSQRDNDQVLRQLGYESGHVVSQFGLYVGNKLIANFGSSIHGHQQVYCNYKSTSAVPSTENIVPIGDGEQHKLKEEATLMLKAMELQNKDENMYLSFLDECWLQPYFENLFSDDNLVDHSETLCAEVDFVHGSISENMNIGLEIASEIHKTLKSLNKDFE